jgi:hypothetical protein
MRILSAVCLLFCSVFCFAVQKNTAVPDFSGTWKLDPIRSTAEPQYLQASSIVVTPCDNKLQFEFVGGEKLLFRDVYTLDGRDRPSYSSRTVTKAYVSARMNKSALIVRTRAVLDQNDTQEYIDTDTWSVSPDGKMLTDKKANGKLVYYTKQPEQPEQNSSEGPN